MRVETIDLRFPTSHTLAGSDAMNHAPDYSAAYVVLHTDTELSGHGFTFTIGRGNELCIAAIQSLATLIDALDLDEAFEDMGRFWRRITSDSQLRWVGPEKGVIHLATAAIVNAVWDLYAKREGKPLWKLLVDMPPQQLVDCVDFKYIRDALTYDEALDIVSSLSVTKPQREAEMRSSGFPAYTTSVGWLGYSDADVRRLTREARENGWTHFKMKVGRNIDGDIRRAALLREEIGDAKLMMDANQVWNVDEAIHQIRQLQEFDPYWIEEPTSPDDILGHATIARAIAPIRVATGEHVHNRVMFKQFFQARAIGICQIDACRLGGVNEVLGVILLAKKFDIPVCPHSGGVGLCEYTQHLSIFDYICISADLTDRVLEYHDHLHEHFLHPATVYNGRYVVPTMPGYSAEILPESRAAFRFPQGSIWQDRSRSVAPLGDGAIADAFPTGYPFPAG